MNKFKWEKKYLYWGMTAFLVIIACISFFWVIQRWDGMKTSFSALLSILSPIIGGMVLAYLLTPLVKPFQAKLFNPLGEKIFKTNRKKAHSFGRGVAIFAAILSLVVAVSLLLLLIIPQVYQSIEGIVMNLSSSMTRFDAWANKWLEDFPRVEETLSTILGDVGTSFSQWARNTLLPQMKDIVTSVSVGVISVVKAVANIFIAIVVSVYVMFSREKFLAQGKKILYSIFSTKHVKSILSAFRFTNRSFMGFFSGKILDAFIVGVLTYIACLIIGLPDAVLIGVIIGVTNIIPFFGPFIGAIPCCLIVLMYSPIKCIIFIVFIIVLQQFDGNILEPKILSSTTGLSGFWVLFSIILGAGLFGPIGLILGVPLFAVLYAGVRALVNSRIKKRGLPVKTADYADMDHIDPETLHPVPMKTPEEVKEKQAVAKQKAKDAKGNDDPEKK
ncbi:MAG: AI-2E family transporter [Oscillospiraceae bacterium]